MYLYGDSTTSMLRSNLLEYLRDALDFCVFVLQADARMRSIHERVEENRLQADRDIARLGAFGTSMAGKLGEAGRNAGDSPTGHCENHLAKVAIDEVEAAISRVRERLSHEIAQADSEESTERDGCVKALEVLLVP